MSKLPISFFQSEDVVQIAQKLLGMRLFTKIDGNLTGGKIVETEAYAGAIDKASHAYGNKFTNRTSVMYNAGGIAYVYLCYGIHHLVNIVTGPEHKPHAVLIRGLEPLEGIETMLLRRKMIKVETHLTAGPGALSQALGIDKDLNGVSLLSDKIWIESDYKLSAEDQIVAAPRIGVGYAGADALLPYRFYIKNNSFVSKPRS